MTPEELEIAKAACCVGTIWDEYEGKENFDRLVGKRVQHLIELVRKYQPSLHSNLDEAAEDSWAVYEYRESPRGLYSTCYVDGFKAGAEWMAGQGETVEGYIAGTNEVAAILAIPRKEHNKGDKVVVQIRKKQ